MGYAGYAPGLRVADKGTPLHQALRALPLDEALESLELIHKLTVNVVRNPAEDKFRRIKLSNPKIAAGITNVPGAQEALLQMGWQAAAGGDTLELPASVSLTHENEVLAIIDAKDYYKKAEEEEKRRQMRARKDKTAEELDLQKKLEDDRKEKAAEVSVAKDSVAKPLGDGARIVKAADLGIGQSKGG